MDRTYNLAFKEGFTFRLWVMVLLEESYGKMQVDGLVRQKDS